MEHALSASQEQMLHSLDFSLSSSASYVIQRTSSSFYPSACTATSDAGDVARLRFGSWQEAQYQGGSCAA